MAIITYPSDYWAVIESDNQAKWIRSRSETLRRRIRFNSLNLFRNLNETKHKQRALRLPAIQVHRRISSLDFLARSSEFFAVAQSSERRKASAIVVQSTSCLGEWSSVYWRLSRWIDRCSCLQLFRQSERCRLPFNNSLVTIIVIIV